MRVTNLVAGAATAIAALAATAPADAQARVEVGVLECVVGGGSGFILGSNKPVSCTFHPANGAPLETYTGELSKFGIDIGRTDRTTISWAVLAPPSGYAPRALAGTYVGASGEASVGVGGGANLLVGGSNRAISLQPLSVQAQTGVNIALGAASLTLN